jgi:hypothetical protein
LRWGSAGERALTSGRLRRTDLPGRPWPPPRKTEAQQIDLAQVRELLDGGAQLAEVLPRAEHAEEHLPGASTSSSRNWTPPPPHGWTAPPGDRLHLGREIRLAQVYDDVAGRVDWSPTAADIGQHAPSSQLLRMASRVAYLDWEFTSAEPC